MSARDQILATLRRQHELLSARYPIHRLALFGSWARGDAREDSDVDVLVEVDGSIGLRFVDLADEIEQALGRHVDLVSRFPAARSNRPCGSVSSPSSSMPKRDADLLIDDILAAIEKIDSYTRGVTREAFLADHKTIDAVVRNLEIIGEAARRMPAEFVTAHPDISWHRIAGFRNRIVHEYFGLDLDIV